MKNISLLDFEEKISPYKYDNLLRKEYGDIIVGVDECGRGSWASFLLACAVILPPDFQCDEITDSKKLNKKQREKLSKIILDNCLGWAEYRMGNALIDEQGLNPCNKYAMEQASLRAKWNYYDNTGKDDVSVYVADGTINLTALDPLIYQPRLDSRSLTVAAASILGKHIRDTYMEQLSQYYPEYGWDTNSGYINDHHIEAVKKYGLTIYHRKSYKIRKLFNEQHED